MSTVDLTRDVVTLCVECGPDVRVDEDGCCVSCGNGALPSESALGRIRARFQAPLWQPIATLPDDCDDVILRPHRIWGAMDVQRISDEQRARTTTLSDGIDWRWINGDLTTAWTDEAFHPYWMPRPQPPASVVEDEGTPV